MTRWPGRGGLASRSDQRDHRQSAWRQRRQSPAAARLPARSPPHGADPGMRPARRRSNGQTLGRGHQHPHIAVLQDEGDLLGLEQRIDRHEDAAGSRRAETGDDGLEALFQVDGDAFAARQAEVRSGRWRIASLRNRACPYVHAVGAIGQCRALRRLLGGHSNQVRQQGGFGHGDGGRTRAIQQQTTRKKYRIRPALRRPLECLKPILCPNGARIERSTRSLAHTR